MTTSFNILAESIAAGSCAIAEAIETRHTKPDPKILCIGIFKAITYVGKLIQMKQLKTHGRLKFIQRMGSLDQILQGLEHKFRHLARSN